MSAQPAEPLFTPQSVLKAALEDLECVVNLNGQEVSVQVYGPDFDGDTAFIEVFAAANPFDDRAATYRYRIEFAGVAPDPEPRYRKV